MPVLSLPPNMLLLEASKINQRRGAGRHAATEPRHAFPGSITQYAGMPWAPSRHAHGGLHHGQGASGVTKCGGLFPGLFFLKWPLNGSRSRTAPGLGTPMDEHNAASEYLGLIERAENGGPRACANWTAPSSSQ
jgi:hypothetical protein